MARRIYHRRAAPLLRPAAEEPCGDGPPPAPGPPAIFLAGAQRLRRVSTAPSAAVAALQPRHLHRPPCLRGLPRRSRLRVMPSTGCSARASAAPPGLPHGRPGAPPLRPRATRPPALCRRATAARGYGGMDGPSPPRGGARLGAFTE